MDKKNTDRNKAMEIEQRRNEAPEQNLKKIKKAGRPPHKPTDQSRNMVLEAVGMGMEQTMISKLLDIAPKTLRKFYRDELDTGVARANMTVAKSLYGRAISGKDTIASIFMLKARAGGKEAASQEAALPQKIEVTFALPESVAEEKKAMIAVTPRADSSE